MSVLVFVIYLDIIYRGHGPVFTYCMKDEEIPNLGVLLKYSSGSQSPGLTSLWVRQLFHRHNQRPPENTDTSIMIHNSSKSTVMKQQRK